MKDKTKVVLSIIGIFFLAVVTIGVSYAFFNYSKEGTTTNVITVGNLKFLYTEISGVGNGISMTDALPMSDTEGKAQSGKGKVFDFKVEAKTAGAASIPYEITAMKTDASTLDDSVVKLYLTEADGTEVETNITNNGTTYHQLVNSTIPGAKGKTIYQNEVPANSSNYIKNFKLRMWIDENTDFGTGNYNGKTFTVKINVYANAQTPNYADNSGAAQPELERNMIPVIYNERYEFWEKADVKTKWYDYDQKQWANAVTVDQNKVLDLSSNDHNGTIHGATVVSGQATFDGVDDYIDCGLEEYIFESYQTMMIRLKIHSLNEGRYTTFFSNFEDAGSGFFYDRMENKLSFQVHNGTQYIIASVDYNLNSNQFYTLAGSFDGENVKLYIDGELVATTPGTGYIARSIYPYLIGGNPGPGSLGISENSKITVDKVMISWYGLSDEYIKDYSQKGMPVQDDNGAALYYDFKNGNDIAPGSPISMGAINTMMVWIPRYKYVMPATKEGQIDIVFENKKTAKSTGTATSSSYLTHPAFTFGKTELNGLWVGKFETSPDIDCQPSTGAQGTNCDITTINPQVKPNVKSWTGARVSTFFTASRNMQISGNPYGYRQSGVNTHMMKNSEWGAVSYLTQSKYGRCTDGVCTEVTMNNLNSGDGRTITGCAADTITASETKQSSCPYANRYDTDKGVLASTTGNVYGIYDMSGGDWEYVMGNYNKYSGYTAISYTGEQAATILGKTDGMPAGIWNSGFNGPVYGKDLDNATTLSWTSGIDFPEEKYYDLYTATSASTSCNGKPCLGDALYETAGWYSDYQYHVLSQYPWFFRGGGYGNGSGAGVLSFSHGPGYSYSVYTFRLVVSAE